MGIGLLGFLVGFLSWASASSDTKPGELPTPLEASGFQQLTTASERSEFLRALTKYPSEQFTVQLQTLGMSGEKRPIEAILIKARHPEKDTKYVLLRVLMLGAQHGSEISGCEALLSFAGKLITGFEANNPAFAMTFLIIPAVNPDGIANKRRVNAQGINLSTDYGLLLAPESTAVNKALLQFKPHVVLDIHESALLKKKTLGAEGWLTDFEAQFECANNPNVNTALQTFTFNVMLPEILKSLNSKGLPANRYIGEITRTDQIIQHGGLSAHNFRNKAGIYGAASFLLENRLDPSTGTYPTPRNIRERVEKQLLCINTFLSVCRAHSAKLASLTENARHTNMQWRKAWLQPEYGTLEKQTTIDIALRRRENNERVLHCFKYRGNILAGPVFMTPKRYIFLSHIDFFKEWLTKQGISFIDNANTKQGHFLTAEVNHKNGLLLPLFLEPASASTIIDRLPFDIEHLKIRSEHQ
ncbi:MAG: M14 family zinc carboxypeptidase [Desulfobacterales bacterium]